MKIVRWMLLCCCTLLLFPIQAQKKINKSYSFTDGVYMSHQDFKTDKPSFPLYRIPDFDYQLNGEKNLLFLSDKSIAKLPESEIKSLDSIWGLCIKGEPYMKVDLPGMNGAIYFVRYYVIGRICYFYYPTIQNKEVEMVVYSPYTGAKVAKKTVVNRERTLVKKMMLFETGETQDYNAENFKIWAKDDVRLMKTLDEMTENEIDAKLFKTLKIYNDRHPIFAAS